jgi:glycosyltransferase involved in cell wall biosynthesis
MKYSVIIPCYNCAKTIGRAVRSVQNEETEIICVNDGSTDDTPGVLHDFAEQGIITVVELDDNHGPGYAINRGIENADTDLIFVLGADNYLPSGLIAVLHEAMLEAEADIAAPEEIRYFGGARKKRLNPHKDGVCDIHLYAKTTKNHGSSGHYLFTKRSWRIAGGYPEGPGLEGWVFGLRQLAAGCKAIIVKGTYHHHSLKGNTLWKRWEKQGFNRKAIAEARHDLLETA